jgi:hypothetical protein
VVGIAQLVEHLVVVQDVAGSSPVTHPERSRPGLRKQVGPSSCPTTRGSRGVPPAENPLIVTAWRTSKSVPISRGPPSPIRSGGSRAAAPRPARAPARTSPLFRLRPGQGAHSPHDIHGDACLAGTPTRSCPYSWRKSRRAAFTSGTLSSVRSMRPVTASVALGPSSARQQVADTIARLLYGPRRAVAHGVWVELTELRAHPSGLREPCCLDRAVGFLCGGCDVSDEASSPRGAGHHCVQRRSNTIAS